MARSRKNPDTEEHPIPDDWRAFIGALADDPAYQRAWAYAASMGNPHKACYVFADNKWQEFEAGGEYAPVEEKPPSADEIQDEIDRLTKVKERLEASAS